MPLRALLDKIWTVGWFALGVTAVLFVWKLVLGLLFFGPKTVAVLFILGWVGGVLLLCRAEEQDWVGPRVRILYDDLEEEDLP